MANKRDDFTQSTKDKVGKRVVYRCSFEGCRFSTVGPKSGDSKNFANVGVACHICAAAPGGPRYDPNMMAEERKSADNCIWMCETHAHLIDTDVEKYPAELLRKWKKDAEEEAAANLTNYKFSRSQLSDKSSLTSIFNMLIKEGNYDTLRMLIETTKVSDNNNELLLRYGIIYNIYCNREALLHSINYYVENIVEKECDELLKVLVANNIAIGIDVILPFCSNKEIKVLANKVADGQIKEHLFRTKEEMGTEKDAIPVYKGENTILKLLSNIITSNRFPALPTMADGNKFNLYIDEFSYEMAACAWVLFGEQLKQNLYKKGQVLNESYTVIKKSINKVLQLDKELQLPIWMTLLDYVINDSDEFNCIYNLCPVLIQESKECKRIKVAYDLIRGKVDADKLLDADSVKEDENTLVDILHFISKEKRYIFLDENKYLFRKKSIFIYLWSISCGLTNAEICKTILMYSDIYKNDFLWNCLLAYYQEGDEKPANIAWLKEYKQQMENSSINLYIGVLQKYSEWNELKTLSEIVVPSHIKYQIGLALATSTTLENIQFCIELFNGLESTSFYTEGFYSNFAILYYRIKDIVKAKYCLEKEYDKRLDESSLLELLKLRYESLDFKFDKYTTHALRSSNSDILLLMSIFFEKTHDLYSQKIYILKALLANPENTNALRRMAAWYLHNEKDSEKDIGKIYCIKNCTRELKIALIDGTILDGIEAKKIIDCLPLNRNASEYVSWDFCDVGNNVKYLGEDYEIISVGSFSEVLSVFVINRLMSFEDVTTISGEKPEDALDQIKQLVTQRENASNRIFSYFNETQGIFPISLLAAQLGNNYTEVWTHIVLENKLKINNFSSIIPENGRFILTNDSIITLSLLGALNEFKGESFILPQHVKTFLISKVSQNIDDMQEKNAVGSFYSKDNQLYRVEYNKDYKRKAILHFSDVKGFIEGVSAVDSDIYKSSNEDFRKLFFDRNLVNESYILGLAQGDENYVIVTDEPFICAACELEKIPHISAIDLLLQQNLTCDKLIKYLEKLNSYNFLNFFNAKIYKKVIDLALQEDEETSKKLISRFEKWLLPEERTAEHKQRVFNAFRELGLESQESPYFHSLGNIGRLYFSELYPDQYKTILESIKNMKFEVSLVSNEEDKLQYKVELVNSSDTEE